tara:strand:- start:697 stop:870 length:174 start_codon:yes stop_codon:yes gene_type:complete
MAKFDRYDPRNKKRDNHKDQRIREIDEHSLEGKQMLQEVVYDSENDVLPNEPRQLNT